MNIEDQVTASNKTLGIRGKLFLGFAAIIIVLLVSVSVSLVIIYNTENFSENVINRELPIYSELVDLNSSVLRAQNSLQAWVLTSDGKFKSEFLSAWDKIQQSLLTLDSQVINDNSQLKNNIQIIRSSLDDLKTSQLKVLSAPTKETAIQLLIADVFPKESEITEKLNTIGSGAKEQTGILDIQSNHLSTDTQSILSDMILLKRFEYGILLIGVILSIIITMLTAQNILPPLNKAINIAKKIASGERNIKVAVTSSDETGKLLSSLKIMQREIKENENKLEQTEAKTRELFNKIVKSAELFSAHSSRVAAGDLREHLDITNDNEIMTQLGKDLNKMTENLASITKEIMQACQHMVTTVEEVHHAVDAQSAGASEQASSVNEITASLSEIEKSSAQTMMKAKALGESAERTREKGQQGLEAVDQSVDGMKSVRNKVQLIAQTILDLSNQTHQVGEITAVVNNLAQQSKMLALNASIEAAKAGEAGKGFAVVAVEVKNLAEQSEQATTQVQKILEDIQHAAEKAVMVTEEGTKGVDAGTQLVEQTGEIIRNLNEVIHETTIASQQIESAVRQESAGIEQITAGMSEINQVTNAFVESVKQTTEAISNLADIAKGLKSYIDTYKL